MENDRARFHILRFLISIIFDFFKIRFLKMVLSDLESISKFSASSFWLLRFQWRSQGMEREPLASIFWQENGNPVLRFYIWWLLQGCLKNHGSRILKIDVFDIFSPVTFCRVLDRKLDRNDTLNSFQFPWVKKLCVSVQFRCFRSVNLR